jgi:hypothetical protein
MIEFLEMLTMKYLPDDYPLDVISISIIACLGYYFHLLKNIHVLYFSRVMRNIENLLQKMEYSIYE